MSTVISIPVNYELDPKFTDGLHVAICVECSRNTAEESGHYHTLDLYFSADEIPARNHIIIELLSMVNL